MRWMMRTAMVLSVLVAIAVGSMTGVRGTDAAGYQQWYGPYSDGCYYFGDGASFVQKECLQTDGTSAFYVPDGNGYWVYVATGTYDSAGCLSIWVGATLYSYTCPTSTFVIGGTSLDPQVAISNGGATSGALSGWQTTGIWGLDQYMLESQDQNIDIWLQPRCNEIYDYTCDW